MLTKSGSTKVGTEEDEAYFVIDEIKNLHGHGVELHEYGDFIPLQMLNHVYLNSIFIIVAYAIKSYGGLRFLIVRDQAYFSLFAY